MASSQRERLNQTRDLLLQPAGMPEDKTLTFLMRRILIDVDMRCPDFKPYWPNEQREIQSIFAQAKKKYPYDPKIQLYQAMFLERMHDYESTLRIYKNIEKKFPTHYIAYLYHAFLLQKINRYQESKKILMSMFEAEARVTDPRMMLNIRQREQANTLLLEASRAREPVMTTTAVLQSALQKPRKQEVTAPVVTAASVLQVKVQQQKKKIAATPLPSVSAFQQLILQAKNPYEVLAQDEAVSLRR